jgi:hypothetical protein
LIEGTPHSAPTLVEHVRVDHRRADIAVAQQFLDRPDVMARFEQVRRERVAQRVTRFRAWDSRSTDGVLHRSLNDRFVQVAIKHVPRRRVAQPLPNARSQRRRSAVIARVSNTSNRTDAVGRGSTSPAHKLSRIFQDSTEQSFAESEDPAKDSATSH